MINLPQFTMRDLYDLMMDYEGGNVFDDILMPWHLSEYAIYLDQLTDFENLTNEHTEELFAFSVVLEILSQNFQPNVLQETIPFNITLEQYLIFTQALGLTAINPSNFHPFYCEIIKARHDIENFALIENLYPTLMLKNLIIQRAGSIITLDKRFDINLVNHHAIYWAYIRCNRKYYNLSQGWGHNSRWHTDFRIDLKTSNGFIYNALGKYDLNELSSEANAILAEEKLSVMDMKTLIRYRQFSTFLDLEMDYFPYHFKYFEPN